MNLHPEMRELMSAAMSEGLRWYKTLTPEEIRARVRQRLLSDQKPLRDGKKQLVAEKVYQCTCLNHCLSHLPWCEGKYDIVFESKDRPQETNGRTWYGTGTIIDLTRPWPYNDGGKQP